MEILIAGYSDFEPAIASELIVSAKQAALAQDGCIACFRALDAPHPRRVSVYQEWIGEAAFANHFAGRSYSDMGAQLRSAGWTGFAVKVYRSDFSEPAYDDNGLPRGDVFTAGRERDLP